MPKDITSIDKQSSYSVYHLFSSKEAALHNYGLFIHMNIRSEFVGILAQIWHLLIIIVSLIYYRRYKSPLRCLEPRISTTPKAAILIYLTIYNLHLYIVVYPNLKKIKATECTVNPLAELPTVNCFKIQIQGRKIFELPHVHVYVCRPLRYGDTLITIWMT